MTTSPLFVESEQSRLRSFRRAAKQVRDASIIAEGQVMQIRTAPGESGFVDVYVQLLGNEAFRSLAMAIRLVYQQGEPGNFFSICNLLALRAPSDAREQVSLLRSQYRAILNDSSGDVAIDDGRDPRVLTTSEVFEHWLYGLAFHQNEDRQPVLERLAADGARFHWSVQASVLQMAGRILDLDDVIADLLGEARLPRIGGSAPAA